MDLSIIIVNYNVKYFLEQCLCSVLNACEGISSEVIVIDNNSTDDSRNYLEGKFEQVKFVWNETNSGFGAANNQGAKLASGKYLLLLNPDTLVPENCFKECLTYIRGKSLAGALGVRMMDGSGNFLKESKRSFPNPRSSFFKLAGLASLLPQSPVFAGYYASTLKEKEVGKVEVLAGAFIMVSKEVFDKVDGFDESFFMYGEDIDLCYRIHRAGYENQYFGKQSIIHFKGESAQQQKEIYVHHFYNAMNLFVKKHYGQDKATKFFMQSSISLASALASLKQKTIVKKDTAKEKLNTLVIARQQTFDSLLQWTKFSKPPMVIFGCLHKAETQQVVVEIQQAITKEKINCVIFCAGDIAYKQMITVMNALPGLNYFFHGKNTKCIVGSRFKGLLGVAIAAEA